VWFEGGFGEWIVISGKWIKVDSKYKGLLNGATGKAYE